MRLLGSNVLIEVDKDWGLQGGIALPANTSPTVTGTVKEVGPGPYNEDGTRTSLPLTKGDRVIFREYYSVAFGDDRFMTFDQLDAIISKTAVTALNDRIIIVDWKEQDSIIKGEKELAYMGTVHAAGPESQVSVGDRLVFARWSALPFNLNDEFPFLIIRDNYVHGVL